MEDDGETADEEEGEVLEEWQTVTEEVMQSDVKSDVAKE